MPSQRARTSATSSDGDTARSADVRPIFSRSLPATPDSVRRLRRLIAEFARRQGANARALESVNLAVSEAVTNAVLHAYRDADRPGPVLVVATVEGPALLVTVSDDGCGMTARYDSPGGGRGMSIIATLSDTLEIGARAAGRTGVVLRMRFRLSG